MKEYRCKICSQLIDAEKAEIVSQSDMGVIFKCPSCSGANSWGIVSSRGN